MAQQPKDAVQSSKWTSTDPWSEVKHAPGAYPPSPNPQVENHLAEHSSIAAAVKSRRQEYLYKKSTKIKIGSWNVAAASGAEKDLAGWFVKGYGAKGLSQQFADLSTDESTSRGASTDEGNIESVEDQEQRVKAEKGTLPEHDISAVAGGGDIDIYALGLQEVIDITSMTEAIRPYYDPNTGKKWKQALEQALPAGYAIVAELQLLGLLILVYAAPHVAPFVTSVESVSVGTGALGYMGNKGATSVRIVLHGITRILFVNCHLAAGADKAALERRIWDTGQILSRTKFAPANYDGDIDTGAQEEIGHEDFAFWFGDLNYRLEGIPGEDVRRLLLLHTRNEYDILNKSKRMIDSELGYVDAAGSNVDAVVSDHYEDPLAERPATESSVEPPLDPKDDPASLYTTIQALLAHDQLRRQQRLGKAFHEGWREGEIHFLPTYKYDIGSVGMFDSGEKKRSPSWCDRILYRSRRDKDVYDQRILQDNLARKRDEELKAKGVDKDAADQEILFNYDPETDGADEYDEYNEDEDTHEAAKATDPPEEFEEPIILEDYISHQRVLTSDHKPLSAVFTITHDAVDTDLKTKIHSEVTRDFDKNENDTRPSITVVVENHPTGSMPTDSSAGSTELSDVVFEPVKFRVPQVRTLTIANTSPIPTTFAFIDRPIEEDHQTTLAPSWLTVHVNHDSQSGLASQGDLGAATPFLLEPGDMTTVDLTVDVSDSEIAHRLNRGAASLDDILVLRVLNGRDHFVRVTGSWLQTCFCRTLDELVRIPNGVRNLDTTTKDRVDSLSPASPTYHSAPRELFMLTEGLPTLMERSVADWTMTHVEDEPPWFRAPSWPFLDFTMRNNDDPVWIKGSEAIREALDTATSFEDQLSPIILPIARVELLADSFVAFVSSLRDGIISATIWAKIESKLVDLEKSKLIPDPAAIQELVMDLLSSSPIHSVSFTFITFMLTRMINELSSEIFDATKSPQSARMVSDRERSPTQISEVPSETSMESALGSPKSRFGFLPSFPRRRSELVSGQSTPTTPQTPRDRRAHYTTTYVETLAPVLIRAEQDTTAKGKDLKSLILRKRRILEAFLIASMA